ncbi:sugar ABC transporter ATP-binding protein [Spirochaetia bacterium]|nr:sugar ABC transporter ATP-binding protein [Spirochaetia bacterium]
MKFKYLAPRIPVYVFVAILSVIALLPFYMMIIMGTHYSEDLYTGIKLWPGKYLAENLNTVLRQDYFRYYRNSIVVSVTHTAGAVLICSLAGYAFAKYRFKGRSALLAFVVATIAVPQQVGMIGFVVEMRIIGWINTLLPLIVSGMASAFGVFWLTQYITASVPLEIIESGRIDGCNEFGIFFRLVMPIIRPALITISLLLFLWNWNSYMTPLVTISNQKFFTIPLSIALVNSEYRTDYAARVLALAMGTVPIVVIFAFGSKHLIRGLVAGSVKG